MVQSFPVWLSSHSPFQHWLFAIDLGGLGRQWSNHMITTWGEGTQSCIRSAQTWCLKMVGGILRWWSAASLGFTTSLLAHRRASRGLWVNSGNPMSAYTISQGNFKAEIYLEEGKDVHVTGGFYLGKTCQYSGCYRLCLSHKICATLADLTAFSILDLAYFRTCHICLLSSGKVDRPFLFLSILAVAKRKETCEMEPHS